MIMCQSLEVAITADHPAAPLRSWRRPAHPPPSRTPNCSISVQITARSPPAIVYAPVATASDHDARMMSMSNSECIARPPR